MAGPCYSNTKVDGTDVIAAADLEAIEDGFDQIILDVNDLSGVTDAVTALTSLGLTATAAEINQTDGNLFTSDVTIGTAEAGHKLVVSEFDAVNAGGRVQLNGAAANPDLTIDNSASSIRYYGTSASTIFHSFWNIGAGRAEVNIGGTLVYADAALTPNAQVYSEKQTIANNATGSFTVVPMIAAGGTKYTLLADGSVNYQGEFHTSSTAQVDIGSGANVSYGGAADPSVAGNLNVWASGTNLQVKNLTGASREVVLVRLARL